MIEVADYDPAWVDRFTELAELYGRALEAAEVPFAAIEHVGSTAVPGLAAKPVIDIDIVVTADQVPAASAVFASLGFTARGELGIPQRWAFYAPEHLGQTHTYVVVEGSLALINHLAVRDTLRGDPVLREEYARVKRAAGQIAADIYEYGARKNDTVQRVLRAAGLSESERTAIQSNQVPEGEPPPLEPHSARNL